MAHDTARIGVMIAEDNADLVEAVGALIAAEPDMCVVGTVGRVAELAEALRVGAPQVLVLDLDLAGESSVPTLLALRQRLPGLGVVLFSGNERDFIAPLLEQVGRCEYVTKNGDVLPLLDAIRRCARS